MISRRRMAFQLTALLDLLLVVLFAQYLETQEASDLAVGREWALRRQADAARLRAEAETRQTDRLKRAALEDRAKLTEQIDHLAADRKRLQDALAATGTTRPAADETARLSAQLAAIGDVFRRRLKIAPESLEPYLISATPGERQRLLDSLKGLADESPTSVVRSLRDAGELRKISTLWEVHVFDDNSVRLRIDGQDRPPRFQVTSASDMANHLIDAAKEMGEPRTLVVVLLTWSDADRRTRDAVSLGIEDAVTQLRPAWGAPKRIELARLGYTQTPP